MEPRTYLPLHPRDYLILFTLVGGERHGYGIVKDVERESEGEVTLDPANLYRSLRRLIRDGLVRELDRRPAAEADGERRRFFAMTDLGREVLRLEALRLTRLAEAARSRGLVPRRERPA